ncbi:hypothetical protein F4811DRAFT_511427 [Daldinia bambusicola]|nr:hypothetical protein F4811DRAFT_511427 [Daldinia bambusicola]
MSNAASLITRPLFLLLVSVAYLVSKEKKKKKKKEKKKKKRRGLTGNLWNRAGAVDGTIPLIPTRNLSQSLPRIESVLSGDDRLKELLRLPKR